MHTVRGKKSRTPSPFDDATVERSLVSSIPITTAPLANLAIFPVSSVIKRDPISNSSVNVSRTFRPGEGVSGSAADGSDMKRKPVLQTPRRPNLGHERETGTEERRRFVLLATDAIETPKQGREERGTEQRGRKRKKREGFGAF